jgi:hypothetical protein
VGDFQPFPNKFSYSSWLETTNYILEMAGQLQVTSAINFNNPITNLTRIQSQTRRFVDVVDRLLNRKIYNRDNLQEFQLQLQPGNPQILSTYVYPLDPSTRMENIRYYSFFNITPQSTTSSGTTTVYAQQLFNKEYREFRAEWPDFTAMDTGPPQLWIIMPKTLATPGVGIQSDQIAFYPVPDQNYTVVYQASLKAVPLLLDTDPVLFTKDNEDVIWHWGRMFLEEALGEGKGQLAQYYAAQALDDYLRRQAGPEEERHAVRTGMNIYGPMRGRYVNFWSDTNTTGT